MTRQFWLAATAVSILLLSAASASADTIPGWYITGDGGASWLPDLHYKADGTKAHEHFNTGYAYGGAMGYDSGNGMRLEIDTTHQMSNLKSVGNISTGGHLQSTSMMANAQMDLLHNASVTPYVGAGAGYENIGANVGGFHDADWKPAYQAEAGLRTDLSQQVSLFGEYRFQQSEAADLSIGGTDAHQHFADHGLLAGLTYHMGQ